MCLCISPDDLQNFTWDRLCEELQRKAPTVHFFLTACCDVKRRERPLKHGQKKVIGRTSPSAVVGVCASVLLRHRNQQMNMLQHLVSLILHRGHAGKQVKVHPQVSPTVFVHAKYILVKTCFSSVSFLYVLVVYATLLKHVYIYCVHVGLSSAPKTSSLSLT